LAHTTNINVSYVSVVPSAIIYNHKRYNSGPIDLVTSEDNYFYYISLKMKQDIYDGYIDNIQFTLSWDASDVSTEQLISNAAIAYNLKPQGEPKIIDGKKYLVFAVVDPDVFSTEYREGTDVNLITISKKGNISLSDRISIPDNDIVLGMEGEYYASVWGLDMTGNIGGNTNIIVNNNRDDISLNYYPNPTKDGIFTMNITTDTDQELEMKVFDILGVCVYKSKLNVNSGKIFTREFNLGSLPKGTYLIDVSNNKVKYSGKIVLY